MYVSRVLESESTSLVSCELNDALNDKYFLPALIRQSIVKARQIDSSD